MMKEENSMESMFTDEHYKMLEEAEAKRKALIRTREDIRMMKFHDAYIEKLRDKIVELIDLLI